MRFINSAKPNTRIEKRNVLLNPAFPGESRPEFRSSMQVHNLRDAVTVYGPIRVPVVRPLVRFLGYCPHCGNDLSAATTAVMLLQNKG